MVPFAAGCFQSVCNISGGQSVLATPILFIKAERLYCLG